jgi:hypothetical protein
MDFLKKIFSAPAGPSANFYSFSVKCSLCGEVIEGRVNLNNDLSVEYEGSQNVYFVRKVLMGTGRCFQQVEVELKFNESRKLLQKQVAGGMFVE